VSAGLTRAGALLAAALLAGCATTRPAGTPVATTPAAAESGAARTAGPRHGAIDLDSANVERPLRFEREDLLKLEVWGYPELERVAGVQANGMVTLPLVGEVPAAGQTPAQVAAEVSARLTRRVQQGPVRIHKDDALKLVVWRQPDLTHVAVVQMDGRVTLPLIGEVQAEGLTIEELRGEVLRRLSAYLNDPQVSILPEKLLRQTVPEPQVSVLPERLRERRVAVFGDVFVPGLQPIRGHLRVLEAVATANHKESAQLNQVVVIRVAGEDSVAYRVARLRDYIGGRAADQNFYLEDNDIVIVPRSLIGEVDNFIDRFFIRTKPVFDWWISLQYARFAADIAHSTVLINDRILNP
jgi:polysaccharide export outer membrane protein